MLSAGSRSIARKTAE
jgi:hypothetical protein